MFIRLLYESLQWPCQHGELNSGDVLIWSNIFIQKRITVELLCFVFRTIINTASYFKQLVFWKTCLYDTKTDTKGLKYQDKYRFIRLFKNVLRNYLTEWKRLLKAFPVQTACRCEKFKNDQRLNWLTNAYDEDYDDWWWLMIMIKKISMMKTMTMKWG